MEDKRIFKIASKIVGGYESLDDFTGAYVEAALWSSTDDDGSPLDSNYDVDDIDHKTLEKMKADCKQFKKDMAEYLYPTQDRHENKKRDEQGGHDFWLTREGHGAGFWDSDRVWSEEEGKIMTEYCRKKGGFDLYVGDDGKIYN